MLLDEPFAPVLPHRAVMRLSWARRGRAQPAVELCSWAGAAVWAWAGPALTGMLLTEKQLWHEILQAET